MNHIFEWGNTFVSNSPWTTYLNGVTLSSLTLHDHGELVKKVLPHSNMWFMESYWRKYYPIQICGSWSVSDEGVTPFKYVVHGELVMKVLPHSNMWFMESYWRKYYPIQICGSWRVSDESVTPFKYVVHRELLTRVTPSSLTLHEPHIWMG
jgi:hypothetical protein